MEKEVVFVVHDCRSCDNDEKQNKDRKRLQERTYEEEVKSLRRNDIVGLSNLCKSLSSEGSQGLLKVRTIRSSEAAEC